MSEQHTDGRRYTLRFPVQLISGLEIGDESIEREIGDLKIVIRREDRYHVFEVEGFSSEEAAKEYLNNLWAGLMWVLLRFPISFKAELGFGKSNFSQDLVRNMVSASEGQVDDVISPGFPYVYPSDKRVVPLSINAAGTVTTPFELFYRFFAEGITAPNSAKIMQDAKLRLALELYAASFYEHSLSSRFLTRVMVLEVLKTDAQNFVRRRIQTLVKDTLAAAGNPDAEQWATRAFELYGKRSSLVHTGRLPDDELDKAVKEIDEIVKMVLRAKFMEVANGDSSD